MIRDNFKKDRSICRRCYTKYNLVNNSSRPDVSNKLDSSRKQDDSNELDSSNKFGSSTKQDDTNDLDSSNKFDSSRKQVSTRKQDSSSNQDDSNIVDLSINNITEADPDLLCDNLRENLSKSVLSESDYTMTQMIIDELLRVRCITRKQYKAMREKIGLI